MMRRAARGAAERERAPAASRRVRFCIQAVQRPAAVIADQAMLSPRASSSMRGCRAASASAARRRERRWAGCLAGVLLLLAMGGCQKGERAQLDAAPAPAPPAVAAPEPAKPADGADPLAPVSTSARKLIQEAELRLEVESYEDARRSIDAGMAQIKGYVANAQIEHADARVSRAELTLRIPAAELPQALASFRNLGTVLHESLKTQDITEEYVDLEARIATARKLEARLLELLAGGTKDVKDLLEVERELARVRESLERLEGKRKLFDGQVAMSTLTLRLVTRQSYEAGQPRGLGRQLSDTLGSSWRALGAFGRGALVVLVALLPWLPLLLGAAWIGWRSLRWLNRALAPRHAVAARASAVSGGPGPGLVAAPIEPPQEPPAAEPAAPDGR